MVPVVECEGLLIEKPHPSGCRYMALGLVLPLLLAGCASRAGSAVVRKEVPWSSVSAATSSRTASALPTDASIPTEAPQAAAEAAAVAGSAFDAYCRPSLTRQRWLDGLARYLTQDAAAAYATVDPAQIPCSAVRGVGRVVAGDGAFTMRVAVVSDRGTYTVWLSRPDAARPWLVDRFVPPGRR